MAIHAIPTKNGLQSTLSSTLSLAETTSFAIADDWSSYLADVTATRLIILCIDRVDANGTRTPTKREYISATTVTGGSGTTFTTLVRGLGGSTQQAHTAGAVVEVVVDVNTIKSITDGFLVEHNADGTHNLSGVVTVDGTSSISAEVRLAEDTDNGTNYMGIKAPSAVTASVTLTLPDGAGSNGQVLTTNGSDTLSWSDASGGLISTTKYAPEGFLINGKIVPTVASNDLIVSIKGMDGNDPSASNPVYVRIGDTVRTITSALGKTLADGTNWFNAGSAEIATKEVDYFVYLGYNATDGVVVGFSRIPNGTLYSSFSATTTNEKYCAISTITNAAAGDNYVNVGRFAATLSAGAGYTWTVPTFTTTNLIQRPIYETRVLTWTPTYSAGASMTYTSVTTAQARYTIRRDYLRFTHESTGTTGGTASNYIAFTLPWTIASSGSYAPVFTSSGADTAQFAGITVIDTTTRLGVRKYDTSNWGLAAGKVISTSGEHEI